MNRKHLEFTVILAIFALLLPLSAVAQDMEDEEFAEEGFEEEAAEDEMPSDGEYFDEEEGVSAEGEEYVEESEAKDDKESGNELAVSAERRGVETYWGDPDIVEVVKGLYMSSRFGFSTFLVGDMADQSDPGMMTGFGVGYDIVDRWFALELDVLATINQAGTIEEISPTTGRLVPVENAVIKGDALVMQVPLVAHLRYAATKRLEVYLDLMGGLAFNMAAADGVETVQTTDANGDPVVHRTGFKDGDLMDFFGGGRLGVEYYTGLRHFSVGFEIGSGYLINASSLYIAANPTLKYTF